MTRKPRSNRRSLLVLGVFSYLWLMVGIGLATLTLAGPLRWVMAPAGRGEWTYGSVAFALLVFALILLSLVITRWLLRRTLLSRKRLVRAGIPAVVTFLALLGVWLWLGAPAAGAGVSLLETRAEAP